MFETSSLSSPRQCRAHAAVLKMLGPFCLFSTIVSIILFSATILRSSDGASVKEESGAYFLDIFSESAKRTRIW